MLLETHLVGYADDRNLSEEHRETTTQARHGQAESLRMDETPRHVTGNRHDREHVFFFTKKHIEMIILITRNTGAEMAGKAATK